MFDPLRHWGAGKTLVVGIIGLGGLGDMGLKLAKALGHEVVVISTSAAKEQTARDRGADHFVNSKDEDSVNAQKGRCNLILNTVASDHDVKTYLPLLANSGTIVMLGLAATPQVMRNGALIGQRKSIAGSLIGGSKASEELLELCAKHNILPTVELVTADQIDWVYEQLNASNAGGTRYVIDIKKSLETDFVPK